MFYAIRELGQLLIKAIGNDETVLVRQLVDRSRYEAEGEQPMIIALHFRTTEDVVELEELCEADIARVEEFLWIGNARSASLQNRLTTNNLKYLLSQTIPNLLHIQKGLPPNSQLFSLLCQVKEQFFRPARDFGVEGKEGEDPIIDIKKFKLSSPITSLQNNDYNELLKDVLKLLTDDLNKKLYIKKIPENTLYTVLVDGEALVKYPEYSRYIYKYFLEEPFEKSLRAPCHLCGRETEITKEYSATRFDFSFYIMDKIGFASGITEEGFYKNFSLCKNCYSALLLGQKFVWNHLRSTLGGRDFCIIPSFSYSLPLTLQDLERLAKYLKDRFKAVETLEGYTQFRDRLEEYAEEEEQSQAYSLNLLFYHKPPGRSEFRILKLIEDIPPSRLDDLTEVTNKVKDVADKLLGEDRNWYIGIECINRLLSYQQRKDNTVHYRYVLDFYESLLTGKPVEYQPLIDRFVELSKGKFFDPKSTDIDLVRSLLQTNLLLEIVRQLDILKGGDFQPMDISQLELPENIKAYMGEIKLDEPRGALFLLGYLIGEIGNAQYRAGSSAKPILDKITFQGMNLYKLLRLSNDILDKLRQYRLLDRTREKIHSVMKHLMDKNFFSWKISDQENVYWVLSGYAFSTWERIRERPSEEIPEEEEEQNE